MLVRKVSSLDVIGRIDFSSEFIYGADGLREDFILGRTVWEFEYNSEFAGLLVFEENIYDKLVIDIFFMYITSSLRKMGLGKAVLIELENYLKSKKGGSMMLEVRVDNEPALKLYKNFGFRENRLRKNYYNGRVDGLELIFDV